MKDDIKHTEISSYYKSTVNSKNEEIKEVENSGWIIHKLNNQCMDNQECTIVIYEEIKVMHFYTLFGNCHKTHLNCGCAKQWRTSF